LSKAAAVLILWLVISLATGTLAAGILGLVILALLPFANRKEDGPERRSELKKKGDTIAAVLTILGLFATALWLTVGKGAWPPEERTATKSQPRGERCRHRDRGCWRLRST
jgi:O-antigen ligase